MSWTTTPLKHVARVGYGLGQPPALGDAGVPILRATNIRRGKFTSDGLIYAAMEDLPLDRAPLLLEGEILVVRSGAYTGDSAIVTKAWAGCAPGYDLRVSPVDAHPKYISYCMLSKTVLDQIDLAKARAAQPHLSAEDLGNVRISLPSLGDQRRIADFLDDETARIDTLVNLHNKQVKLIDTRYRTAISELLTPGISAEGERNNRWPWLPGQIATMRLGYTARIQTGITVDSNRERTDEDGEYPYLRVANVQGEEIDLSEIKSITVPRSTAKRSTLVPGDVVMTEANGNPEHLGRGAVWHGEVPGMVHQNHIFAIRAIQSKLTPDYLSSLLASEHGRRYFRTTSTQVGIATTSSSKVLDFPVPILPVERQQQVVKQCEEIRIANRRAIDALTRQLSLLAERRQALITAAVTGGISV